MKTIRWLLAPLALALCAGQLRAQGFVVVVRADNPVASLSRAKLSDLFLKRATRWDDGSVAVPVDLDAADHAREAFTRQVHGKAVTAVQAFWQQQIFSGKLAPPVERSSDEEVLEFVRSRPGAIGYVSAGTTLGAGVKAVPIS
jgi:ABC-type phosphate transport system, periplasmic component